MNILMNKNVKFDYAGYFISKGAWIHPERTESTYELIFVTRGEVCMYDEIAGQVRASDGQVLVLEPNSRHYGTEYTEDVRFYWVHFSLCGRLPFSRRYFKYFGHNQLFRELLHLCNLPDSADYAVNAVLVHILSELTRLCEPKMKFDRRAEEIYEYLRINADAELKAENAAAKFGMSRDHLTRILKGSYGCGFKELCDRFIMAEARGLLCNTELYVKEIASRLKFSSDKAFIGFFKYHEGAFPNEFRESFSKTHMNNK